MNLDFTTISILSQVVYKEMKEDNRQSGETTINWEQHKEETLELARNIIRLNKSINPTQ